MEYFFILAPPHRTRKVTRLLGQGKTYLDQLRPNATNYEPVKSALCDAKFLFALISPGTDQAICDDSHGSNAEGGQSVTI